MSVALSNGASVVAFIGLSINTLQGLHYLYEIIERVKGAPQDLQCVYFQLKFFELSFSTFQHSLEEGVKLGIVTPLDEQTRLAIDDAQNTIKQLQDIVCGYGEGRATKFGTRVRVAMNKSRLGSLSRRLEKTSEQIHATHCGISMLAQNYHHQVCAANSSNLDKQLLMLHNTVSKNAPEDVAEKLEVINQAVTEPAELIMNLIVDISRRNDPHLVTSPRSWTSRRTSRSPLPVNSKHNRNLHQMLEDDLVTQLTTHLSVPIRNAVRDALLDDPLLSVRTLNQPELDGILRRVFDAYDLRSCEASSGHSQNWRSLFRVYGLVSAIGGRSPNFPAATRGSVQMFEPRLPRSRQLLFQLLSQPYFRLLKPYLTTVMKIFCLFEPLFHILGQYSITGHVGQKRFTSLSYDPIPYFPSISTEPPFRARQNSFLLQGAWITNNLDDSKLIEDINGRYMDPKTFFYPGRYSEMVREDGECANLTSMSLSQYLSIFSYRITESLPEGDCIFIPSLSTNEVSIAKEVLCTDRNLDDNLNEYMLTSFDFPSLLLPTISLLIVTISWIAKRHFSKVFVPFCNFLTAANFMRITTQVDSFTMWYLMHPEIWCRWRRIHQLMYLEYLDSPQSVRLYCSVYAFKYSVLLSWCEGERGQVFMSRD